MDIRYIYLLEIIKNKPQIHFSQPLSALISLPRIYCLHKGALAIQSSFFFQIRTIYHIGKKSVIENLIFLVYILKLLKQNKILHTCNFLFRQAPIIEKLYTYNNIAHLLKMDIYLKWISIKFINDVLNKLTHVCFTQRLLIAADM